MDSMFCFKAPLLAVMLSTLYIQAEAAAPTLTMHILENMAMEYRNRDAFIRELIKRYPELTKTEAIFYRSRSPEKASVSSRFPRYLLGTSDGEIFVAYTSDPQKPGFNKVQIIDQKAGAREIEFDDTNAQAPKVLRPQSCMQCHGENGTRLIFDSYVFWPGAFGSNERYGPPKKELLAWKEHLKRAGVKGLDEMLLDRKNLTVEGYKLNSKQRNDPAIQLAALGDRLGSFSDAVVSATMRRIAREIKANPHYPELRYALYSASLGCDDFQKFLPSNFRSQKTLAEVEAQTKLQLKTYHSNRNREYDKDKMENVIVIEDETREDEELSHAQRVSAKLRYIMESYGVNTDSWSSTLDLGSFAYESANLRIFDIQGELALPGFDSEEIRRFALSFVEQQNGNKDICEKIKQKYDAEFSANDASKLATVPSPLIGHSDAGGAKSLKDKATSVAMISSIEAGRVVVSSRCVQCHSSEDDNGMALDNIDSLRKQFKEDPSIIDHIMTMVDDALPRVKRMPKTAESLTESERLSLKLYLDAVVSGSVKEASASQFLPERASSLGHKER